jgi:hypothetical protein
MDFGHQFVGDGRDNRESANPLARGRFFPVLPDATNPERSAVLHGDGVRLLGFLPFDGLPFEEAIHWNNAAPPPTLSIKPRRVRGFFSEPPVCGAIFGQGQCRVVD